MSRRKLCILHWMPVERFPPAINLARHFAVKETWQVSLCTNRNFKDGLEFSYPAVDIVRGTYPHGRRGVARVLTYASFHLKAFLHLVKTRPDCLLYIEPHSALPALLQWPFQRRCRLFIHYHEYHAPGEYFKPGMRMARWFHHIEKKWLYSAASWISQTNSVRLELFLADQPECDRSKSTTLANYPPESWAQGENRAWSGSALETIKLVYVGAVSRTDTFIEEAVNWVRSMGERATLDIYSQNLHSEALAFLRATTDDQIRFHESGVPYDDLPQLLRGFHAGLILYRATTLNYAHNATNKLFEYLACGLDVIYPKEMEGVKPFRCMNIRPRVIECDFTDMAEFTYELGGRQELPASNSRYTCETELGRLEKAMLDAL